MLDLLHPHVEMHIEHNSFSHYCNLKNTKRYGSAEITSTRNCGKNNYFLNNLTWTKVSSV